MARKLDEPQDRGNFLKSLGTLMGGFMAAKIEDAITSVGPTLLRPPGAQDELAFLTSCTRCDKCIPACPEGSILKATAGSGLAMGTPYILARSMPCFLCSELPCVKACPEEALTWPQRRIQGDLVEGPRGVHMGTARVRESRCLTWSSESRSAQTCRTCVDRCPYPDQAIRMVPAEEEGQPAHPEVIEEACTGCGLCCFGCPTMEPAIVIDPRR
jgi:MauM/NapG family ferredoxin protein